MDAKKYFPRKQLKEEGETIPIRTLGQSDCHFNYRSISRRTAFLLYRNDASTIYAV